jgi:hypothetical protein
MMDSIIGADQIGDTIAFVADIFPAAYAVVEVVCRACISMTLIRSRYCERFASSRTWS